MRTRIVIGGLILLAVAGMFWMDLHWGGYFICLVAMAVTGVALYELFEMARRVDLRPFTVTGIAFGVALLPYYLWSDQYLPGLLGPQAFTAFLTAPFLVLMLAAMGQAAARPEGLGPQFKNIAVTVFGVLYVALPMTFLVRTRFLNDKGWDLVILVIAAAKATDIGAYFCGTAFGHVKLAPRVSPNKTVEGAVGGVIFGVLATLAVARGLGIKTLIGRQLLAGVAFGAVVAVASLVGDLTESLIKRSTNTKDSGRLLPSFGGMLDIVDSLLVAAPVAYFVLSVFAKAAE